MAMRPTLSKKGHKEQLKVQIDPTIHGLLRKLCEKARRTPAGQIEFMTVVFARRDVEGAGETSALPRRVGGGAATDGM